ncbi:MAG: hypothetical protein Q9191_002896, partial [Dirinaria sp. TL-2023a]
MSNQSNSTTTTPNYSKRTDPYINPDPMTSPMGINRPAPPKMKSYDNANCHGKPVGPEIRVDGCTKFNPTLPHFGMDWVEGDCSGTLNLFAKPDCSDGAFASLDLVDNAFKCFD